MLHPEIKMCEICALSSLCPGRPPPQSRVWSVCAEALQRGPQPDEERLAEGRQSGSRQSPAWTLVLKDTHIHRHTYTYLWIATETDWWSDIAPGWRVRKSRTIRSSRETETNRSDVVWAYGGRLNVSVGETSCSSRSDTFSLKISGSVFYLHEHYSSIRNFSRQNNVEKKYSKSKKSWMSRDVIYI